MAVPPLRNEGFDDHLKVIVPDAGQAAAVPPRQVEGHLDWSMASAAKDYTPREWDPQTGRLTLDFVKHDGGLASTWSLTAKVGDPVHIAGPKNSALLPTDVEWLLVGGDETALPAIGRLLQEWPAGVGGQVFVEIADPAEEQDLPVPDGVTLTWLHRRGVAAGHSSVLADAVMAMPWRDGEVYCWFAGEAMSLKPIRRYLKERGVPADCLEVSGYWRRTEESPETARLVRLLSLTPQIALRVAIREGVIARLEKAPTDPATLAADLGLNETAVRALARALVAEDVLAADESDPAVNAGGLLSLGPVGQVMTEEYAEVTDPRAQYLDLSVASVTAALHGQHGPRPEVPQDLLTQDAAWATPSLVQHHEWDYPVASVIGSAAPAVIAQLHSDVPNLPVATSGQPGRDGVIVACWWLEQFTDDEALAALQELEAQCRPVGATVILAERLRDTDEQVHDHDAELDLQLLAAYGSGLRCAEEVESLVTAAGFAITTRQELGWDMRSWELTTGQPA
ncbi:siderophore-interacting protein [Branchiibius cervicis]|uniref:Siderophore-interacting protein n=1 Tax=Branchiibius cervicis TaxID=908252 RepID=A0ABW2AVW2_9MICO